MKKFFKQQKGHKLKKWFLSYDSYKTMKTNFFIGIARGIGTAIGFSVLGAILLFVLNFIPIEKIPLIGKLLQEFNEVVRSRLG